MNKKGVTLIELMVVVSIIGILAIALGFSYVGWRERYRVEKAAKDLYTDLMDVRGRAISRGTAYFSDFNLPAPPAGKGRYRIIEDTNGNLVNNAGAGDNVLPTFPKTIDNAITWSLGGTIAIAFERRGVVSNPGTICFTTTSDPDYDCIIVSETRINLGKLSKSIPDGGVCAASTAGGDCVAK
jgi:prepilin-type N-terminal cleavage/methylation domain-containing protein